VLVTAAASAGLVVQPAAAATSPVTLVVAPEDGGVLRAGRDLDVTVAVTNDGTTALPAGSLDFSVEKSPAASSSALLQSIANPPQVLLGLLLDAHARVPAIGPGDSTTVRARIGAEDLAGILSSASGARQLYVRYGAGATQTVAESAVVRMAKGTGAAVDLGTVVPLVAPAGTTGVVDTATQQRLTDRDGAWDLAIRAAEAAPWATVALDPAVLASVRLAGDAAPPAAQALLERLQRLPNQVVRLPYADGDVTLERAAGLSSGPLGPSSFAGAAVLAPTGEDVTAATPSPTPTPGTTGGSVRELTDFDWSGQSVAWPVPGTTTPADVTALAKAGDTLLLPSADVQDTAERRRSGPAARLSGSATALIADSTASALLAEAADSGPTADAALAQLTGVLATAAVTGETAALLATPGRAADTTGLARALTLLGGQPWVHGRSLASLAAARDAPTVKPKALAPAAARVATARDLLAGERRVRQLGSAITEDAALVTGPQRLALLGALSAAWRGRDGDWDAAARAVETGFSTTMQQVSLVQGSEGNVIGSDGNLKVTVRNALPVPIKVQVRASVSNGRLQFSNDSVVTIAVPAQAQNRGNLAFRSITNGRTDVTLRLTAPDGAEIGSQTRQVNVSAGFDTIVAVVLLTALGLLLAIGVYRNVKRRRHPRAATS
jgi:hypothetical protein